MSRYVVCVALTLVALALPVPSVASSWCDRADFAGEYVMVLSGTKLDARPYAEGVFINVDAAGPGTFTAFGSINLREFGVLPLFGTLTYRWLGDCILELGPLPIIGYLMPGGDTVLVITYDGNTQSSGLMGRIRPPAP